MYAPPVGRWISEDPVGYVDGPNRYLYTDNGPVMRQDPSGLKLISSEIKECDGYIKGDLIWDNFSSHGYVLVSGIGYGYYQKHLNSIGVGEVRSGDESTYPPATGAINPPHGGKGAYAVCVDVMIEDCCIDKLKHKAGALSYITKVTSTPGTYTAGVNDCFTFRREVVNQARIAGWTGKCTVSNPPCGTLGAGHNYSEIVKLPPGCI